MKTFRVILLIIFLFLGGAWIVLSGLNKDEDVIKITRNESGKWGVELGKTEEEFLKKVGKKVKDIIYREATKHNPEGDVLPDQIDDRLIEEAKERIN